MNLHFLQLMSNCLINIHYSTLSTNFGQISIIVCLHSVCNDVSASNLKALFTWKQYFTKTAYSFRCS